MPKTVIPCTVTEAWMRKAAGAAVAPFVRMAGPKWSFVELPTGHWPMFSAPEQLAAALNEPG